MIQIIPQIIVKLHNCEILNENEEDILTQAKIFYLNEKKKNSKTKKISNLDNQIISLKKNYKVDICENYLKFAVDFGSPFLPKTAHFLQVLLGLPMQPLKTFNKIDSNKFKRPFNSIYYLLNGIFYLPSVLENSFDIANLNNGVSQEFTVSPLFIFKYTATKFKIIIETNEKLLLELLHRFLEIQIETKKEDISKKVEHLVAIFWAFKLTIFTLSNRVFETNNSDSNFVSLHDIILESEIISGKFPPKLKITNWNFKSKTDFKNEKDFKGFIFSPESSTGQAVDLIAVGEDEYNNAIFFLMDVTLGDEKIVRHISSEISLNIQKPAEIFNAKVINKKKKLVEWISNSNKNQNEKGFYIFCFQFFLINFFFKQF